MSNSSNELKKLSKLVGSMSKAVYGSISKLPERFAMVSKDSLRMAEELQHPLEK